MWKKEYKLKIKNPEYYEELENLEKYYQRNEKIRWYVFCLISAIIGIFIGIILAKIF